MKQQLKEAANKDLAIERGLQFIYKTACNRKNFSAYGHDYLGCFACIATTSADPNLRRLAREMGRKLAQKWRREYFSIPRRPDAGTIACLVLGSQAADALGVNDSACKNPIREVAAHFDAEAYFGFNPRTEPPPQNVPEECKCGYYNPRDRRTCRSCRRKLSMRSRYDLWLDALIFSYAGDRYGVTLGTCLANTLKWLPLMRPYPKHGDSDDANLRSAIYAVTHVVYVLNDYNRYNLSPSWLPAEFAFLRANVRPAMDDDDPETVGELLDSLKSFGCSNSDPVIRRASRYLLSNQNADGSWGDIEATDIYDRYHPTWTAIDGLRDYSWRGERLSFKKLAPLVIARANKEGS
jgi:hypothetical protein